MKTEEKIFKKILPDLDNSIVAASNEKCFTAKEHEIIRRKAYIMFLTFLDSCIK